MPSSESGTNKTKNEHSKQSREVATVETQQEGLQLYSTELKEGISAQGNFLSTHAQRLTNLIHSEVEAVEADYLAAETPDARTTRLSEQSRESVLTLGHQLLETVKLGMAVHGVQMKIERGEV